MTETERTNLLAIAKAVASLSGELLYGPHGDDPICPFECETWDGYLTRKHSADCPITIAQRITSGEGRRG